MLSKYWIKAETLWITETTSTEFNFSEQRTILTGPAPTVVIKTGHDVHVEDWESERVQVKAGGGEGMKLERRGEAVEVKLGNARLQIGDIGGYWEALIGKGEVKVRLKAGGDVTLVTGEEVMAALPDYLLGRIVKPAGG